MKRAHKIRIYPNNVQATMLSKHCGVARLAYNTCLAKWNDDYEKNNTAHNYYSIKKWFNSIKKECYPFVFEVSKWAAEAAIADLGSAFKKFFSKQNEHPKFHKKGIKDSFRIDGSVIKVLGKTLFLPKGLKIQMAEELRFEATKIYNVTISKASKRWFVSIQCEVAECENQAQGEVGIDLGVKDLAVLSDGVKYENPRTEHKWRSKIARSQRSLHRKRKGSGNRRKAQRKLATIYWKAANARKDYTHKMTSDVINKYAVICLEDLNVKGMLTNHNLARVISDAALAEIRRQFEYKARETRYVGKFEATTKPCCVCGKPHDMPLSKRIMDCECGNRMCRDVNAAINILNLAV